VRDPHKQSFSQRHGRGPKSAPLPFDDLKRLVINVFDSFRERGYFQEAFGTECVDGDLDGTLGRDPDAYFLRTIGRDRIWPYWASSYGEITASPHADGWDADTLFDVIEVIHDHVSKPLKGRFHDFSQCGWHYETFDRNAGQTEFRQEMNGVLELSDPPYVMDDLGQIIEATPAEFAPLLAAAVPEGTEHDLVTSKIDAATTRFRARGASLDDRRHAVRDLADVLEALRSDMKDVMLSKDESELFNIANNFAIRHNNRQQRGDYDRVTWLRWAFYVYLATIHAVLRIRNRARSRN
jgi:hypothetical protein